MKTLLTESLGLQYPVIQAPMAFAAGGKLAASVAHGGGLGLIGGGYGDLAWIREQIELAEDAPIGIGLISWVLKDKPDLIDRVLEFKPKAIFLSFGNPEPFATKILDANVSFICQIQTFKDAQHAIDIGADIIVVQGAEAGGHGESRGLMPLLMEVADYISRRNLKIPLVAAGGISDGRGLVAALALGADGIVMGTRYWASREALVYSDLKNAMLSATGDETRRSQVFDVLRGLNWPKPYTARSYNNTILEKWHDEIEHLQNDVEKIRADWKTSLAQKDISAMPAFVGEGIGNIDKVLSASEIAKSVVEEAKVILKTQRMRFDS